jgi:hypothetical protein
LSTDSSLPAKVPEPIAVALRRATSGIFICSPPEVSSMRLRMIEVMLSPMYGANRFSRTHSRLTLLGELDELVVGLNGGDGHGRDPF